MSSRREIYIDYLSWVSTKAAKRILILFVLCLILLEIFWRGLSPQYPRTAISSLHGIRAILQEAIASPHAKILAFGDSTLLGGGVYDSHKTVMGLFSQFLVPETRLFNLAIPGGDTVTSTLLLDSIKTAKVKNIDRVIVEVLPWKFMVSQPEQFSPKEASLTTAIELQRYVPFIQPQVFGLQLPKISYSQRIENYSQWWLGNISMLYRHRDFLRTEFLGNYPIFWLLGSLTPKELRARLFPAKAQGLNRLAARADDLPFDGETSELNASLNPAIVNNKFTAHTQGDYLEKAIEIAKQINPYPPIIVSFPIHYEYSKLKEVERQRYLSSLKELREYLERVAAKTESELMFIDSKDFQDPQLWTRSLAHFNSQGHEKIWRILQPALCNSANIICESK